MLHYPLLPAALGGALAGANEDIGVKRGAWCYELDVSVFKV